jgi:hypothetical protein
MNKGVHAHKLPACSPVAIRVLLPDEAQPKY